MRIAEERAGMGGQSSGDPLTGAAPGGHRAPSRLAASLVLLALLGCGDDPLDSDRTDSVGDAGPRADVGPLVDTGPGRDGGEPADLGATPPGVEPLFGPSTPLSPALSEDTGSARITRFADRGRDRHARETGPGFESYEHYLTWYWEDRTIGVTVTDTVGHGGSEIRFDVVTPHKLDAREARLFFMGRNTVAEYCDNGPLEPIHPDGSPMAADEYAAADPDQTFHYAKTITRYQHPLTCAFDDLAPGQRIEIEISQFLESPNNGRENYYGTTFLYIVGEGLVPWEATGPEAEPGCCALNGVSADSLPVPVERRLGGDTTTHRNESNEPNELFLQMATNTAPENAQPFMQGRRLVHSSVVDGRHDENPVENPPLTEVAGLAGPAFINESCSSCHVRNGRALPAPVGQELPQWVFRVGDGDGGPDPLRGVVLQPRAPGGLSPEGNVRLGEWVEVDGLRSPTFVYEGGAPAHVSPRISPQLVGMGLLEAIPESLIAALADPDDADGDGISGRMHVVREVGGPLRLGRFGYKASQPTIRQQVAAALRTDMGVTSSVFPTQDCVTEGCDGETSPIADARLDELTLYIALLGVRPQAAHDGAGETAFVEVGCASCHVQTFETSPFAPLAELRQQTIHPYTDLLLHDMGPGLADTLVDGDAAPQEWRTTPLWGLGKSAGVAGGSAYLHDGRARTLDEAIRWHGGEADGAREAYEALSAGEREALLAFLRSL